MKQQINHLVAALFVSVLGLGLGGFSTTAGAHGGEIEIGGGGDGPVTLSDEQAKAIGLTLVPSDFRAMTTELSINGEIALLPDRRAGVSTRISGQITELYVQPGQRVQRGQKLARVQSRLLGDPPPSVNVSAPLTGVIDEFNVQIGQSVEPSSVLFSISDRSKVNMVARTYEEDIGKLALGLPAQVRVLSYPDEVFSGKLSLIGPDLDAQSRTVATWVTLDNPDGLLIPNMFGRANVILNNNPAALVVPTNAILEAGGEKFVFTQQGAAFNRVDVTTGANDAEFTEITSGLIPADVVVTIGNREVYTLWLSGGSKPAVAEEH